MEPASEGASHYQGSFGFEAFLCQLFRQIDPVAELNRKQTVDLQVLKQMADASRRMSDICPWREFSDEIRAATREVLFHERVHYWQLLSTSAMQRQVVNSLAHLRWAIELDGGKKFAVWGGVPASIDRTVQDARFLYENFDWNGLDIEWTHETVSYGQGPPTSLTRVLYGFDVFTLVEGYVADLGFDSSDAGTVRLPLVGRYLLESAAYVSEQLLRGRQPEPLQPPVTEEDLIYRGAWELWRRTNASAYRDDPNLLALAFLAIVDLAVNPDVPAKPPSDINHITIPWRFGTLLQLGSQLPAISVPVKSAAELVVAIQKVYCATLRWPEPDQVALHSLNRLIHIYAPLVATGEHKDAVEAFLNRPFDELTVDEITPVFELMKEHYEPSMIGLSVLRTLINAALFRLLNPGKFELPHLYADELSRVFPLPAVLFDGDFYLDLQRQSYGLRVLPVEYWSDCVRLMTIDHLRTTPESEKLTCGFVRRNAACPYMAAGAGCPKRGLSSDEDEARQKAGLDKEWCHWKFTATAVGLTPLDSDKAFASPEILAAPVTWNSVSTPEQWEKALKVYFSIWQQMTPQERQQALAASAAAEKTITPDEGTRYINIWAEIDKLEREKQEQR